MKLKDLVLIIFSLFITALVGVGVLFQIDNEKVQSTKLLQESIVNESISHFENLLATRKWNASHGGLYVLAHDNLTPNPYLRNNVLATEDNRTLIKINPAWMTKQIAEIANSDSDHYYKMSSLKPINPANKADEFEREALEFFELNKDKQYYYVFPENTKEDDAFDFMGSLKVTAECMNCHAEQGYDIGDIRGGIRISFPMKYYNASLNAINEDSSNATNRTIVAGFIIALLIMLYLLKNISYKKHIEEINENLELKVSQRTQELHELNLSLEVKIADALEKNRVQNESMLRQSRNVAMGEMIGTIAHHWRQPIATINMQANNLLLDIELEEINLESMKKELEEITQETQTISQLISTFSDLFNTEGSAKTVKIMDVLDDALYVLQASYEELGISVEKEYLSNVEINIVAQELFQVFWNVLNNAKDIFVLRDVKNPKMILNVWDEEATINVLISDNAGGVKEENLEKIFEPYYTTSEDLNGKGLGLYIADSIMSKILHGTIEVSNGSDGADFLIRIPKG